MMSLRKNEKWLPIEANLKTYEQQLDQPLSKLAKGEIPAIVIRNAFSKSNCENTIQFLIDQDLLFDPKQPIPQKFIDESIPEGYYREGTANAPKYAWQTSNTLQRIRIDIGSSLGYRGSDKTAFLKHSFETNQLFEQLFADRPDPIRVIYQQLEKLSQDKKVKTAREPDGSKYGAAIFRAHYGGYAYKPHFDSVRLREARTDFAVFEFEHQFAGVLVLQNTSDEDKTAQGILHRCFWQKELDPVLSSGTFHDYAEANEIQNIEVKLEPGDLYFFNTRLIHEVPGVAGEQPRIVLATFIGFSENRDEIFVWS